MDAHRRTDPTLSGHANAYLMKVGARPFLKALGPIRVLPGSRTESSGGLYLSSRASLANDANPVPHHKATAIRTPRAPVIAHTLR